MFVSAKKLNGGCEK